MDRSAQTLMTAGAAYAAIYDMAMLRAEHRLLRRLRRKMVGAATGRVVEIGAGTGANIPFYRSADAVCATDPDPAMLRRARRHLSRAVVPLTLRQCPADSLPFADGSVDTVVATLVLCSVPDQRPVLAEIRRVLAPDGLFRFIEHVRQEDGLLGRAQDIATPLWRHCAGGCHLNRRTVGAIEASGFAPVALRRERLAYTPIGIGIGIVRRGV